MAQTPHLSSLPSLSGQPGRACPKGISRKTLKGRKHRAESKVKKSVRAQCVERDGPCRAALYPFGTGSGLGGDVTDIWHECEGLSEWAHLHAKRRSKTRGMAPEDRHDTAHSLMLCKRHHDQYDGRATPRLVITALTRRGADGPLKFRRAK